MKDYRLRITLLRDATFGRGDGVAGVVDTEVQHDACGLPFLGGRALKGILGAECADIVFALSKTRSEQEHEWTKVEKRLFGSEGDGLEMSAIMRVGPAELPADLRDALARDIQEEKITRAEVLDLLTAVRRQTAMDAETGAPKTETLRSMRVILRDTVFEAALGFSEEPTGNDLALLAACVKAFRRAGTGRNRGRGRLKADLCGAAGGPITDEAFARFREAVSR